MLVSRQEKSNYSANLLNDLVPKQTFGSYATLMLLRFVIGCKLLETPPALQSVNLSADLHLKDKTTQVQTTF